LYFSILLTNDIMDNISLVTTALEYYDTNSQIYMHIFDDVYYTKFVQATTDMDHNVIIFFNKNKKEMFRSKYEVIGQYNTNSNVWIWAWAIPAYKKNNTNIIRKIWNYGAVLDPGPSVKYLKTELITSRFRVADTIQLDIHVSIASYLSKNPLVYTHREYNDPQIDESGLYQIKGGVETENYTNFYMFLLDYKELEKNFKKKHVELSTCDTSDDSQLTDS